MNTCETKNEVENEKIAKKLPRQGEGKGHLNRWKKAVYQPKAGHGAVSSDFNVRIMHQGRRANFPLRTANRANAAGEAAKIYAYLTSNGWDATLAKYKPTHKKTKPATVGELIAEAERIAVVAPRTLRQYSSSLRLIAADLAGIKGGKDRFAHRSPRFAAWRGKVDALHLSILSADAVKVWRDSRIAAEKDPMKRKSAKVSANSLIRQAKSLFGAELLTEIKKKIELPEPLPFAGLKLAKTKNRFAPSIPASQLFIAARAELANPVEKPIEIRRDKRGRRLPAPKITDAEAKREQWKAFVLALLVGLRRAEVDTLTWRQLNLEEGKISIELTEYFAPKSEEGSRVIDIPDDAIEIFRQIKATDPTPNPTFILKGGEARPGSTDQYYRADVAPWQTWTGLIAWLRSKGVRSQKPIHDARKLAGSLINAKFGIEAARNFLGHADIETTSNFYLDKRDRVTVSLNLPETDFAAEGRGDGVDIAK